MAVSHWIKENKAVQVPNRWVWLHADSTAERQSDGGESRSWALAVTAYDHRRSQTLPWYPPEWLNHSTPETLWEYIDGRVRQHGRTVVMAHNMGMQVRISRALTILPAMGWKVERWQVNDRGCVLRLRNGVRSMWLIDAGSWLPGDLERVGGYLDMLELRAPPGDTPTDKPYVVARYKAELLRAGMRHLIEWVETDGLGNWQATAGGMAWAEWRHRHYTHRVLVHDDEAARSAERKAAYTGRCEAWRWGRLNRGRWWEYDMPLCYARVAASEDMPVLLAAHWTAPRLRTITQLKKGNHYLVKATVNQPAPVLPERVSTGIRWPVGEISGWYWDVEIAAAVEAGATVEILEAYRYISQPALKDWAEWIIPFVEDRSGDVNPLRQAVAKIWARALIGRFATRYCDWQPMGDSIDQEVGMEDLVDLDTGQQGKMLQVGGDAFSGLEQVDGSETAPAVMSFVMACARVRLWHLIQTAGYDNVAYCDTDSVIVNSAGKARLDKLVATGGGWGVRAKSRHDGLIVHAPRQLQVGPVARMAGLPRGAEMIGQGTWVGDACESLEGAVKAGRPDSVIVSRRTFTPGQVDHRRIHLAGGATGPYLSAPACVPGGGILGGEVR